MGWREARVLVGLKEEAGASPSQQIVWGIWLEILSKRVQQKSKQREPLRSGEHTCCRQWKEACFFLNTPFQNSSYRYFCFIYFSLLGIEPRSLLMIDKFSTTEHHPYVFFFLNRLNLQSSCLNIAGSSYWGLCNQANKKWSYIILRKCTWKSLEMP